MDVNFDDENVANDENDLNIANRSSQTITENVDNSNDGVTENDGFIIPPIANEEPEDHQTQVPTTYGSHNSTKTRSLRKSINPGEPFIRQPRIVLQRISLDQQIDNSNVIFLRKKTFVK